MPKLIAPSGHALALPRLPCRIGTAKTNDIPIQEGLGVAGHHVTFHQMDGFVVIEDSGSGLGTVVNGAPVSRQVLQGGESVRIGSLELRFELAASDTPAPAAQTPAAVQSAPAAPAVQPAPVAASQQQQPPTALPAQPTDQIPATNTPTAAPTQDERAGLPPVDHKPAEAPLKSLFPKPSQGDNPTGNVERRAKPELSATTKTQPTRKPSAPDLGGLGKPQKKSRSWLPIVAGGIVATGIAVAGFVLWKQTSPQEVVSPIAEAAPPQDTAGPTPQQDKTTTRLAEILSTITRPAAVITVDVASLREHNLQGGIPRITKWLERYLKLPLDNVEHIVAVGASSEDFSLAITTTTPLTTESLADNLGPAESDNVFHLDALSGPLAAGLAGDGTLIVSHRDKIDTSLTSTPLPDTLRNHLQSISGGVSLNIDHTLIERGNLPFFLTQSGDTLISKVATFTMSDAPRFKVVTTHSSVDAADLYAKGYPPALTAGLQRIKGFDKATAEPALKTIATQTKETLAQVTWALPKGQDVLARGLIEMIADPVGTEVANSSVQVLRQDAQRVSALFYTAKKAGAPLERATDVESAIALLMEGVESTQDAWSGRPFQTRAYSKWEREVMAKFLKFENHSLTFLPEGIPATELGKVIESQHSVTTANTPDPLETKSRLDAATIIEAYKAAQTAGADLDSITKLDPALDSLAKGIEVDGSRFAVKLSDEERERAKVFLKFQDDQLVLADTEGE